MSSPPRQNPERELSLIGHLDELRMRLFICVGALFVATMISFFFARPVLEFLIQPVARLAPKAATTKSGKLSDTVEFVVSPNGDVHLHSYLGPKAVEHLDTLRLTILPSDQSPTTQTLTIGQKPKANIIYPSPLDPIMMLVKVALAMGIVFSLGVWMWQIWLFVSPGLTDKEKRVVRPLLLGAVFLFPLGAAFAYVMLFLLMRLMQSYAITSIETLYSVSSYLKLLTTMMIAFGSIFELPLVIALLARIGIVTPAFLIFYRKHIYVGLAFISMIITPGADPFSMMFVLLPLILLFEISVWVSKPMAMMRDRDEAEKDANLA